MSDGKTEVYRGMRKSSYLNDIQIKRDELFDKYMKLSKQLMVVTKNLATATKEKNAFGRRKTNYDYVAVQEQKIFEIEIRMDETEKLINKLDIDFDKVSKKSLREF